MIVTDTDAPFHRLGLILGVPQKALERKFSSFTNTDSDADLGYYLFRAEVDANPAQREPDSVATLDFVLIRSSPSFWESPTFPLSVAKPPYPLHSSDSTTSLHAYEVFGDVKHTRCVCEWIERTLGVVFMTIGTLNELSSMALSADWSSSRMQTNFAPIEHRLKPFSPYLHSAVRRLSQTSVDSASSVSVMTASQTSTVTTATSTATTTTPADTDADTDTESLSAIVRSHAAVIVSPPAFAEPADVSATSSSSSLMTPGSSTHSLASGSPSTHSLLSLSLASCSPPMANGSLLSATPPKSKPATPTASGSSTPTPTTPITLSSLLPLHTPTLPTYSFATVLSKMPVSTTLSQRPSKSSSSGASSTDERRRLKRLAMQQQQFLQQQQAAILQYQQQRQYLAQQQQQQQYFASNPYDGHGAGGYVPYDTVYSSTASGDADTIEYVDGVGYDESGAIQVMGEVYTDEYGILRIQPVMPSAATFGTTALLSQNGTEPLLAPTKGAATGDLSMAHFPTLRAANAPSVSPTAQGGKKKGGGKQKKGKPQQPSGKHMTGKQQASSQAPPRSKVYSSSASLPAASKKGAGRQSSRANGSAPSASATTQAAFKLNDFIAAPNAAVPVATPPAAAGPKNGTQKVYVKKQLNQKQNGQFRQNGQSGNNSVEPTDLSPEDAAVKYKQDLALKIVDLARQDSLDSTGSEISSGQEIIASAGKPRDAVPQKKAKKSRAQHHNPNHGPVHQRRGAGPSSSAVAASRARSESVTSSDSDGSGIKPVSNDDDQPASLHTVRQWFQDQPKEDSQASASRTSVVVVTNGYQLNSPLDAVARLSAAFSSKIEGSSAESKASSHHTFDDVTYNTYFPLGPESRLTDTSDGFTRIMKMDQSSAGAGYASRLSEALSFRLLELLFQARLVRTEMELKYQGNAPKLDYTCTLPTDQHKHIVGVSVTRAISFEKNEASVKADDLSARACRELLIKKLHNLQISQRQLVREHCCTIGMLHVWCATPAIASRIVQEFMKLKSDRDSAPAPVLPVLLVATVAAFDVNLAYSYIFGGSY